VLFNRGLISRRSKPVVVEPSAAQVFSDAGLLPFRQLDEHLGLSARLLHFLASDSLKTPPNQAFVGLLKT